MCGLLDKLNKNYATIVVSCALVTYSTYKHHWWFVETPRRNVPFYEGFNTGSNLSRKRRWVKSASTAISVHMVHYVTVNITDWLWRWRWTQSSRKSEYVFLAVFPSMSKSPSNTLDSLVAFQRYIYGSLHRIVARSFFISLCTVLETSDYLRYKFPVERIYTPLKLRDYLFK